MEHTAKLIRLPHGVQFPADLDGKIAFDAARCCLLWRGFMTGDELRQLLELDSDPDFRRAVARLFEVCNRIETPLTRRLNLALAILVAMCLIGGVIVLVGVALQKSSLKQRVSATTKHPATDRSQSRTNFHSLGGLKFLQGGHYA